MNISTMIRVCAGGEMRGWREILLLGVLASCQITYGQQIVAPLAMGEDSSRTNQPRQSEPNGAAAGGVTFGEAPPSPLQWGPFNVRPHVVYRILYSNGLQATPGHPTSTTINSFSPGFLTEWGTHWTLDYTPTWNEYTSHDFRDTFDQSAKLAWGTTYEAWVLRASQDYNRSTSPQIQTGRQTRETDYITNINGSYLFADNLISETALARNLRFVEGFNDTRDWSILELLHFKESPQLDSALGLEYGYIKTSNAADMSFVQFLARAAWRLDTRVSLEIQGGLENRKIKQTGAANVHSPVVSASLRYRPVETTQLSFTAARATSVSYFANEIVEDTRYAVDLDQRLLGRFRFAAGAEYQEAKFRSTLLLVPSNRKDKSYSFTAGLRTAVFRRIDVTLQYRKGHNTSNVPGYGFSTDQVGLEVGYRY